MGLPSLEVFDKSIAFPGKRALAAHSDVFPPVVQTICPLESNNVHQKIEEGSELCFISLNVSGITTLLSSPCLAVYITCCIWQTNLQKFPVKKFQFELDLINSVAQFVLRI